MSGYRDYLLVLSPPRDIKERVRYCKNKLGEFIGDYPAKNSIAHITILNLVRQKPYMIETAIDRLKQRLAYMPQVKIELNGFDFYFNKDDITLYAAIKPSYRTDEWFALLKKQIKKPIHTPHLTIARTISVDHFYRIWPYFMYKNIQEAFVADRLTILEKETNNRYAEYTICDEIFFKKHN